MIPKTDYVQFQAEIAERNIQYLVHFTRFESIMAIVGEGKILPRNRLHNVGFEWRELISPNTKKRRDDPRNLNASIMHPNVYLLDIFQKRWHPGSRFCVIGIQPKYIYERSTKFSTTNATYQTATIGDSFNAFRAMFSQRVVGRPNYQTRGRNVILRDVKLPSYYSTDPEAEVLVECEVPYSDILFIACRDQFEYDLLASAFDVLRLPTEKFHVNPTLFRYR